MPASARTESINIPQNGESNGSRAVVSSHNSTSPTTTFHRPSFGQYGTSPGLTRQQTGSAVKQLKPFREQDIKILLLENVNKSGQDILRAQGYQVEALKSSLPEDQLIEKIK